MLQTRSAPTSSGRWLGGVSLLCMAGGYVVTRTLESVGVPGQPVLGLIRVGFEAGMVGGLADWYAVTVLFHRAPHPLRWVPIFDKHSRLLVKNRARIADNVVTLVQEEWLTPEAIRSQLEGKSLVEALCDRLEDAATREKLLTSLTEMAARQCDLLDSPQVVGFFEKIVRDQVGHADLAKPIGRWMEKTIQSQEHAPLWESVIGTFENLLDDPALRRYLNELLTRILADYSSDSLLKKFAVSLGKETGAIDNDRLIDHILGQAKGQMAAARNDPEHTLRRRVDTYLLQLATELQVDGSPAAERFEGFRNRLARNADFAAVLRHILGQVKQTIRTELLDPNGDLRRLISHGLDKSITQLRSNPEQQAKLDTMLRDAVIAFVGKNRSLIGDAVRQSLSPERLPDEDLVNQIEPRVSDDLQFIRLNGAVIGFLAGVGIAGIDLAIEWLLHR